MTRQALQLHPTHQQEGDRAPPHMSKLVRGPPTLRRAVLSFFPPRQWVFSLFFSSLTQPHLRPFWALHVPDPPRQNYPSRRWNTSLKPTLYNTWSTQDRSHCHPRRLSPPLKTNLVDLISISFLIYLSFPQSLTLSSSLSLIWPSSACEWMVLMDFCFVNCIY